MNLAVMILAAGESKRLGRPKQLVAHQGTTLLQHAIGQAKAMEPDEVIVVLGARAEEIRASLNEDKGIRVLNNAQWEEGMASSIRCGVAYLMNTHVDAVVIMVCDQPFVSTALLGRLYREHLESGLAIVAAEYGGRPGTPALFHRSVFDQLMMLKGDKGAKSMILQNKQSAAFVGFPEGITDIDTPGDVERLLRNNVK